jgi:hypothetical protein
MTTPLSREIKESPFLQGGDEILAYTVDTSPWGGYSSGVVNVLKDKAGSDVSGTRLQGSPSAVGNVITTSQVKSLIASEAPYRLEVKWVYNGNTFEAYAEIRFDN